MRRLTLTQRIARAARPIIILMIAREFRLASVYVASTVGFLGVLNSLQDFYFDFITPYNPQKKSKLTAHAIAFSVNLFHCIATIIGQFISEFALGLIALANGLITLAKDSYVAYQSQQKLLAMLKQGQASQREIAMQQDLVFRWRAEVLYSVLVVSAATFFTASLFFPPLIFVGIALLSLATIWEITDKSTDFKLSRFLAKSPKPKIHDPSVDIMLGQNLYRRLGIVAPKTPASSVEGPGSNLPTIDRLQVKVQPRLFIHADAKSEPMPMFKPRGLNFESLRK